MQIRRANVDDIPAMMHLAASSATAAHWRREDYERIFAPDTSRLAFVLEEATAAATETQAFMVALCAGPEWEIENIAVAPDARRRGLGTRLLGEFLEQAKARGAEAVFLEVRESNHAARALYGKWAFTESGRRRAYYSEPPEDAITYRFRFPAPQSR